MARTLDHGAGRSEIPSVRERARSLRVARITQDIDELLEDPASARELLALHEALSVAALRVHGRFLLTLAQPEAGSRLLTPAQAAQALGVGVRWVRRHAHRLKSARRLGPHKLAFDSVQLQEDIAGGIKL